MWVPTNILNSTFGTPYFYQAETMIILSEFNNSHEGTAAVLAAC